MAENCFSNHIVKCSWLTAWWWRLLLMWVNSGCEIAAEWCDVQNDWGTCQVKTGSAEGRRCRVSVWHHRRWEKCCLLEYELTPCCFAHCVISIDKRGLLMKCTAGENCLTIFIIRFLPSSVLRPANDRCPCGCFCLKAWVYVDTFFAARTNFGLFIITYLRPLN